MRWREGLGSVALAIERVVRAEVDRSEDGHGTYEGWSTLDNQKLAIGTQHD